jgi:hypothetical protein
MKKQAGGLVRWTLWTFLGAIGIALAQGVYNYFPPPGITYSQSNGMALGSPTGGACGSGCLNAQALEVNGTPVTSGSGTVTTVSVATANGLAGTVATPSTTPAITLSPAFTGIAYSNGSNFATAVAGNFPTLNQSTTGNAATATTAATTTSFATTPTLCASGQGTQGILPNGNATGCFTPYSVVNEAANTGFWGPTSGTAALPTFRTMVAADLPLTASPTWTGNNTLNPSSGVALTINGAPSADAMDVNNAASQFTKVIGNAGTGVSNGLSVIAGTNTSDTAFQVTNRAGTIQYLGVNGAGTTTIVDSSGAGPYQVGYLGTPVVQIGANYTLVLSTRGKTIFFVGAPLTVTVPSGVFSAGDVVTILSPYNAATNTIAQGTGLTLYWANGTSSSTGNRTLNNAALATIVFVSGSVAYISGSGLS